MARIAGGYERVQVSAATLNPQVVIPAQQTTTVGVAKPREKYKGVLYVLGIIELVLGCLSCVLAFMTFVTIKSYSYYRGGLTNSSQGIWCGVFIIASGILGIKVKTNPSVCMYNANMTVSIITANFIGVLMIMSSIAAAITNDEVDTTFHAMLAVIGFAGMAISHKGVVMYMPQQQFVQQPHQMVQLANGQFIMIPSQPVMAQGYHVTSMPVSGIPITYQPAMATLPQQQVPCP